jgi:hypothetical protein
MNITFLITTHERQESCQRLVNALQGQGKIIVLNDGSTYNINGCDQYFQEIHGGKGGYCLTVNKLFALRGKADYYIMLPDDFLPEDNMVERAIEIWNGIKDPTKICLNLYADRVGKPCWTNIIPVEYENVRRTQWVDMCFFCGAAFFGELGQIPTYGYTAMNRNLLGSGVGRQISIRLHKSKYSLYQVKESLVIPQPEHAISQMRKYDNSTHSKYSRKGR